MFYAYFLSLAAVECNVTIPDLPLLVVNETSKDLEHGSFFVEYQDVVQYVCDEGWEFVSSVTNRICQADQSLSLSEPSCQSK